MPSEYETKQAIYRQSLENLAELQLSEEELESLQSAVGLMIDRGISVDEDEDSKLHAYVIADLDEIGGAKIGGVEIDFSEFMDSPFENMLTLSTGVLSNSPSVFAALALLAVINAVTKGPTVERISKETALTYSIIWEEKKLTAQELAGALQDRGGNNISDDELHQILEDLEELDSIDRYSDNGNTVIEAKERCFVVRGS